MLITVSKLNTITQRIEYCLEHFPDTRNSDIDLFARLCENFYPPFEQPIYNWRDLAFAMHRIPSLDHVARARRKIIALRKYTKYLPTDKYVALRRGILEEVWIKYAVQNNIPTETYKDATNNIPMGYNQDGEFIGNADQRLRD